MYGKLYTVANELRTPTSFPNLFMAYVQAVSVPLLISFLAGCFIFSPIAAQVVAGIVCFGFAFAWVVITFA